MFGHGEGAQELPVFFCFFFRYQSPTTQKHQVREKATAVPCNYPAISVLDTASPVSRIAAELMRLAEVVCHPNAVSNEMNHTHRVCKHVPAQKIFKLIKDHEQLADLHFSTSFGIATLPTCISWLTAPISPCTPCCFLMSSCALLSGSDLGVWLWLWLRWCCCCCGV